MIAASLAFVLFTQSKAPQPGFRVWMGASGPRSEVRYARPTLAWQVWADDPARKVVAVSLSMNGRTVPAKYDVATRAVTYTPAQPLAAGVYRMDCRVVFDDGNTVNQKWDTPVATDPLATLPAPDQKQLEAVAAINRIRGRMGLAAVTGDDRMHVAAVLHSKYLAENKTSGHHQLPTAAGYFGATSAMRLEVYGYVGPSWEGVEFGSRNPTEGVRGLFDAPLHRVPFLQPGKLAVGAGFHEQYLTLEFGEGDEEGTTVSPSNGESDVPLRWRNYETPNPLEAFPDAPRLVGYPIVLARFGRNPKLGKVEAKLFGPRGEEVAGYVVPPSRERPYVGLFIPREPLEGDASYSVSFTETGKDGKPREFRVTFRTAAK